MAGLFDLVKASTLYNEYDKGQLANRYTEQDIRDLNISQSPVYLQGVERINPIYSSIVNGRFYPAYPTEINVAVNARNPLKTTGHEAYHAQSEQYRKQLGDTSTSIYGLTVNSPYSGFFEKPDRAAFDKRVEDAYNKYGNKYKLGAEFAKRHYETMADLQGIEATLPSGQTILDTDIGKDIFKTKEEKQMYLKSSLPGVMKALEYDPSLWELAKDRADYAARVFKDKATASSYAKAAADAFKAFMSGPEAKVEYQDPFGDTTK